MPLDPYLHFSDAWFGKRPRTSKFLRRLRRILQGASKVEVTRDKVGRNATIWHPEGGRAIPLLKLQDPRDQTLTRLSWEAPYGYFWYNAVGGFSFYDKKAQLFERGWDYIVSRDEGLAYIRGGFGGPPMELRLENVMLSRSQIQYRASRKGFSFPTNLNQFAHWFEHLPLLKAGISPFTFKPFRPGQQLWLQFAPSDTVPKKWTRHCRRLTAPGEWTHLHQRGLNNLAGRLSGFFESFKGTPSRAIQMALKLATLRVMYQLMLPHMQQGSRYRSRKGHNLPVTKVVYDIRNLIRALRVQHPHLRTGEFLMLLHKQERAWS